MKYPNSTQNIPDNVLSAIRFTAQTGVMSRKIWNKSFSFGSDTWKSRQLNKILEMDILKDYLMLEKNQFYKLGMSGLSYARKLGVKPVTSPLSNQILHDAWVFEMILALQNKNLISEWSSEAQLKSGHLFNDESWEQQKKIPDAVVKVKIKNEFRHLAFEYERTLKTSWRIKEILRAYAGFMQFPLVIVVCEDEIIKQSYLKMLKQTNGLGLNNKIGFTLADGWQSHPENQPIQMLDRIYHLKDILQSFEKT